MATKKNFKNAPVYNIIGADEETPTQAPGDAKVETPKKPRPTAKKTASNDIEEDYKRKARENAEEIKKTSKYYVPTVEVKNKRVQLVLKPSTYEAARTMAEQLNISFNEYIHRLIEDDVKPKRTRKKSKS